MSIQTERKIFIALTAVAVAFAVVWDVTRVNAWIFAMIAVLAVVTAIDNIFDRCPHCGTFQNFPFHRGNKCYKCGKPLNK